MTPYNRVVITGIGMRIPGASSLDELKSLYRAGMAATGPLSGVVAPWWGGLVKDEEVDEADPERIDRATTLSLIAARDAVSMAALDAAGLDEAGVYVGTGGAGMITLESGFNDLAAGRGLKSNSLPRSMSNAPAAHISMAHGCHGPSLTFAMACSSSAHALGEAMLAIRSGHCEVIVAGGTEAAMTYAVHRSWAALRLLTLGDAPACRPFCYERGGLLLGEGSVFFVLESLEHAKKRGIPILADLAGYGARSDASHITAPNPKGQAATITAALRSANVMPTDIDHVSAHGTATLAGDLSETQALCASLGKQASAAPISATKSFHGHLLGAAGAVGALSSLLAVRDGFVAPTINFGKPDPELDLDYVPNIVREDQDIRLSLCNAFGFGGSNAALVLRRF